MATYFLPTALRAASSAACILFSNNKLNSATDSFPIVEIFKGSTGTYLKMGGDDAQNGRALTFTSGNTSSNGALPLAPDSIASNNVLAPAILKADKGL